MMEFHGTYELDGKLQCFVASKGFLNKPVEYDRKTDEVDLKKHRREVEHEIGLGHGTTPDKIKIISLIYRRIGNE